MTHFIHIRNASGYSLARGAIGIDALIKQAIIHKQPAVGLTDFDNFFGALEFNSAAINAGIQPITGINAMFQWENFTARGLFIAQTAQGFIKLSHYISNAYRKCGGDTPIFNLNEWRDDGHDAGGIIMLSGGMNGILSQRILDGKEKDAQKIATELAKLFPNRLYIELQRHNLANEKYCEAFLCDIALELGLPMIATNDCHFIEPNFAQAQEILMAIGAGTTLDDDNRPILSPEHYYKSPQAMKELFRDIPEAIEQTEALAKRCSLVIEKRAPMLPSYTKLNGRTEKQAIEEESSAGLKERFTQLQITDAEIQEKYRQRLQYELSVINSMGFDGYFLIVYDFINYAKSQNIPVGPGRGSGAGSLVAYCLKITDLDPLQFNLLFERFLNPERVSMPDFDIDFCQDERDKVIHYVQQEYGANQVAQIITFGSLQAKAAVRDVGRVLGVPYPVVDGLSKLIPNKLFDGKTKPLSYWLDNDTNLKDKYRQDSVAKDIIDIAIKLEGLYRNASTHAAGVVIAGQDLANLVPIYYDGKSDLVATQYSMKYVESAGLVKFDFLGLRTLSIIKKTLENITKRNGEIVDISKIPMNDALCFEDLKKGYGIGVFQFESDGIRDVLRKMRPDRLEDLIAAVALYRPGPMDNIPSYIRRKHGEEPVEYEHPALESVLQETYGIPIYQEQVMEMAKILAGYSLGGADLLRRAMGKKIKSEMDAQREIFIAGAYKTHQISAQDASKIFDTIDKFSGYGFNKSHAAAYALISYQTAYLKTHYPADFMAAFLSYEMHNTDKVALYIQEAVRMGIKILPLDINHSESLFSVQWDEASQSFGIRYALAAIKGVGAQATESLVQERINNGGYENIWDFLRRNASNNPQEAPRLGKKILENFSKSGVFDCFNPNRRQLLESVSVMARYAVEFAENSDQDNLFNDPQDAQFEPNLPEIEPYSEEVLLNQEYDALGLYLSRHPLTAYHDLLATHNAIKSNEIAQNIGKPSKIAGIIADIREMRTKKGKAFAIITCTDDAGNFEATAFDEVIHGKLSRDLKVGAKIFLTIAIERRQDSTEEEVALRITIINVELLENIAMKQAKSVKLLIDNEKSVGKIAAIIQNLPNGNCPLYLAYQKQGKEIIFDTAILVQYNQQFIQQIKNIPEITQQIS